MIKIIIKQILTKQYPIWDTSKTHAFWCQTLPKSAKRFKKANERFVQAKRLCYLRHPKKLNAFAAKRFKKRRSVSCRRNSSSTFWGCLFSVPKASRLAMKFECLAENIEAFHRCFFWFFCLAIFLRVFGRLAIGTAKHIILYRDTYQTCQTPNGSRAMSCLCTGDGGSSDEQLSK